MVERGGSGLGGVLSRDRPTLVQACFVRVSGMEDGISVERGLDDAVVLGKRYLLWINSRSGDVYCEGLLGGSVGISVK